MRCKKSKVFLLSILSVVTMSLGSCTPSTSATTPKDTQYEIYLRAKESGYSGTYEEWLASIKGEKGADGKDGKDGTTWLTGTGAPDAAKGKTGDFYLDTSTFTLYQKEEKGWVSLGSIKGDAGAKGDKGDKGDQGAKGDTGLKGDKGDTGEKGDKGDQGTQGVPGEKGDKGDEGSGGNTEGLTWLTGDGNPEKDLGQTGDVYFDTSSGSIWVKREAGWESLGSIKGEKGNDGSEIESINTEYVYQKSTFYLKVVFVFSDGKEVETLVAIPRKAESIELDFADIEMVQKGAKNPEIYLKVRLEDYGDTRILLTDDRITYGEIDYNTEGHYFITVSLYGCSKSFYIHVYNPDNVCVSNARLNKSSILVIKNADGTFDFELKNAELFLSYNVSRFDKNVPINIEDYIKEDSLKRLSNGINHGFFDYQGCSVAVDLYLVDDSALATSNNYRLKVYDSTDWYCFEDLEPIFYDSYIQLSYGSYLLEKDLDASRLNGFKTAELDETSFSVSYHGITSNDQIEVVRCNKERFEELDIYLSNAYVCGSSYLPVGTKKDNVIIRLVYSPKDSSTGIPIFIRLSDLYTEDLDRSTPGEKTITIKPIGGDSYSLNYRVYDPNDLKVVEAESNALYWDVNDFKNYPITLCFDNGSRVKKRLGDLENLKIDFNKLGFSQEISGEYDGQTINISIELYDPLVNKIRFAWLDVKKEITLEKGGSLDSVVEQLTENARVKINYYGQRNGYTEIPVTKDRIDLSEINPNQLGDYRVHITYKNKETSCTVRVVPNQERLSQDRTYLTGELLGKEMIFGLFKDKEKDEITLLSFKAKYGTVDYTEQISAVNHGFATKGIDLVGKETTIYITVNSDDTFSADYDFEKELSASLTKTYAFEPEGWSSQEGLEYSGDLKLYRDKDGTKYARRKVVISSNGNSRTGFLSWKFEPKENGIVDLGEEGKIKLDDVNNKFGPVS